MRKVPSLALSIGVFVAIAVVSGLPLCAQQVSLGKEAYLTPPKEIMDAVLAARNENVTLTNLSPDGKKFLITKNDGMPSLQRMARLASVKWYGYSNSRPPIEFISNPGTYSTGWSGNAWNRYPWGGSPT